MKELHSIKTSQGYINIEVNFDNESLAWLDNKKIFRNRQAAHQRRERMEKTMAATETKQMSWDNDHQRYYHELEGGAYS